MEAVIAAIEQEIAQERAIHERAMADLNGLLDAANDLSLSGQRATDGAELPTEGEAPAAPPTEDEGHTETPEPEAEAAPEPDGDGDRSQKWDPGEITGNDEPKPERGSHATPTRAPGQQAKGADAARAIGAHNRMSILRYLIDAAHHDRVSHAGGGYRTPKEIREAVELHKTKVRQHCIALMSVGLVDAVGTTKDRRYRATRKAKLEHPRTED